MKYAFIKDHSHEHKMSKMCDVLGVSISGYYDWKDRPESNRSKRDRQLMKLIEQSHEDSRGTYGSPRIHQDLLASGEKVSLNKVTRLMNGHNIQSKMARKFVITTDSRKTMAPAPDLLKRDFKASSPNKAWVTDTTFIETRKGWLYLAVVLDLYSRLIIGWAMSNKNDAKLVRDALTMAVWRRGKTDSVIVHSDQGSTYASGSYQALLEDNGLVCSMSRKGECLDNAVAESFFGTLKTELVEHEDYHTHSEAKQSLFEYIEVFYNRNRRHSYIGYISPIEYEEKRVSL
ncbi:transposase [Motiliproteus sp. MSK22-1]|nr:transposase [Motiliproteus sp. MSK22-1]